MEACFQEVNFLRMWGVATTEREDSVWLRQIIVETDQFAVRCKTVHRMQFLSTYLLF